MKNKKEDYLYLALIARGYSGKKLEEEYKNAKSKNLSTEELLETFINDLDKDPHCKNNRCCEGNGSCTSFDIFKKNKPPK